MRLAIALFLFLAAALTKAADAQEIVPSLASDEFVRVDGVELAAGVVTGTVENLTGATLRDVRLRILSSWRWNDEKRPGTDDPSWGTEHAIAEIPPGGKVAFRHEGPPPPARDDGRFHVEVTVAGLRRVTAATPQR